MKILLFLVLTISSILNITLAQSPFDILEIKGGHDLTEARKAFKKKAIRYHPDALEHKQFRDDGLSVPQKIEKFIELVNAFSELKYNAPAQSPKLTVENYREFYNQFFTEDKVCAFNSEAKIECETFIKENYPESPFHETNTTNVNMTNIGQFYNRDTIYLACIYKSAEKYQKGDAMMKTWRKLGNKNKEWFLVWGVDCKLEPEICEVVFDSKDKDFESFAYPMNGEKKALTGYVTSVPNISGMAMKLITDIEIQELYEPNFHIISAKAARADKKLAILFTEKHNIPKVWKLLQDKFDETLVLTTVGSSNKKMIEKFEITEYPTMMILEDPQSISTAITYEGGEFKKEFMAEFLEKHSKQADMYFEEYTQDMVDAGKYCGKDDKFCIIFNLQGDYSLLDSVKDVPQQYKKKNIRFLYVKEGFSTELENQPGYIFVKSKRGRYAYVKRSSISLVQFIDDALESAVNFEKMPEEALKNVKTVPKQVKKEEL